MRLVVALLSVSIAWAASPLETARDKQDRAGLEKIIAATNKDSSDHATQYRLALAYSYLAEVATELRDKNQARVAAESGMKHAEKALASNGKSSEYHRILGTLCGQVVPANPLLGMRYGKCALESVNKAIELDPKSALAHVSRGVGNYYLPAAFGGGVEKAIADFQQAIKLDPKLAEAYLWHGIALRKANRNAEAHAALTKALQLNPARIWTKQQLEKTPAK